MGTCEASVAFLETEYIVVCTFFDKPLDLLADIFKSCKDFNFFYVICLADNVSHVGGNDCLDKRGVLRHEA